MSDRVIKAERRDIRRVLGRDTAVTLGHVIEDEKILNQRLNVQDITLQAHETELIRLRDALLAQGFKVSSLPIGTSLWRRLRWVLWGR